MVCGIADRGCLSSAPPDEDGSRRRLAQRAGRQMKAAASNRFADKWGTERRPSGAGGLEQIGAKV